MLKLNIVKTFQWAFEYISVRSVRTTCIVQTNFWVEVSYSILSSLILTFWINHSGGLFKRNSIRISRLPASIPSTCTHAFVVHILFVHRAVFPTHFIALFSIATVWWNRKRVASRSSCCVCVCVCCFVRTRSMCLRWLLHSLLFFTFWRDFFLLFFISLAGWLLWFVAIVADLFYYFQFEWVLRRNCCAVDLFRCSLIRRLARLPVRTFFRSNKRTCFSFLLLSSFS